MTKLQDQACCSRSTAQGHCLHQKLINMTWTTDLGLPTSSNKDQSRLFLFLHWKNSIPAFAVRSWPFTKAFYLLSIPCRPWWSHMVVAGFTLPQKVLLKTERQPSGLRPNVEINGLATWQLLCPTNNSPVCGGIWYQEYFKLGSWENFSLLLLWKNKKGI